MTLAILCPSRGRPHNLSRLLDALQATCTGEWVLYVRLDDDDPSRDEYLKLDGARFLIGQRVFFGASVNELARYAVSEGAEYLAMFGDDVVPESVGWDEALIGALGDRLGVAYGSDGLEHLHPVDLPTHYVTQAEVFKRLGYLVPPTIRHLFADNAARDIGQGLGNFKYVPDAKLSHYHRWNKKAPDDRTYREANDPVARRRDQQAYHRWRESLPNVIARLTS